MAICLNKFHWTVLMLTGNNIVFIVSFRQLTHFSLSIYNYCLPIVSMVFPAVDGYNLTWEKVAIG